MNKVDRADLTLEERLSDIEARVSLLEEGPYPASQGWVRTGHGYTQRRDWSTCPQCNSINTIPAGETNVFKGWSEEDRLNKTHRYCRNCKTAFETRK